MNSNFLKLINHPLKFRLFLLSKLPSAFFSGVRVVKINENSCSVKVPYKWFTTNPFSSTYFACLAMAAEMSTGVLALGNIYGRKPKVSMLVRNLKATYNKKATGVTIFTCKQGQEIKNAVDYTVKTGEPIELTVISEGVDDSGESIAVFEITWSFKSKGL